MTYFQRSYTYTTLDVKQLETHRVAPLPIYFEKSNETILLVLRAANVAENNYVRAY